MIWVYELVGLLALNELPRSYLVIPSTPAGSLPSLNPGTLYSPWRLSLQCLSTFTHPNHSQHQHCPSRRRPHGMGVSSST
ncbi:hypothetical protein B0F90DRAFT_942694 [Multifurca ochricompacta]|uniref:Uncharacterized protein n=1 Tax=Multifurca ochricompacta TaxID=376703 RepID=A0AAD4M986_9AGAM|nr:hypothetical protein B0F90DRAFT_942694 [Multifurca ochricompacta]